jgi:hypothetical protein
MHIALTNQADTGVQDKITRFFSINSEIRCGQTKRYSQSQPLRTHVFGNYRPLSLASGRFQWRWSTQVIYLIKHLILRGF